MKKFIIALAATSALGVAMPAAAQSVGSNLSLRIDQLQADLQAGVRSGGITRNEAIPLRQQLRQLSDLERSYAQGGFTRAERDELRSRVETLRRSIATAARNGDYRDGRYDDDRYDRDCPPGLEKKNNGCLPPGQVGRDWDRDRDVRIDVNRDGYDDRDLNRDGRIDRREWDIASDRDDDRYDRDYDRDDDRDDRDDRYEEPRRGGIGGIIDSVLGGGTLRVGQRVTANARLGAVPYEYRNQYRDGNGVYYRSDGRAIYQIDSRTDVVLRIYGMNR